MVPHTSIPLVCNLRVRVTWICNELPPLFEIELKWRMREKERKGLREEDK